MPKVLERYGIRFHFYGYDVRERPHIHASGKGGEAKVWLDTLEFEECINFKANDQSRILQTVRENHSLITEAWNDFKKTAL